MTVSNVSVTTHVKEALAFITSVPSGLMMMRLHWYPSLTAISAAIFELPRVRWILSTRTLRLNKAAPFSSRRFYWIYHIRQKTRDLVCHPRGGGPPTPFAFGLLKNQSLRGRRQGQLGRISFVGRRGVLPRNQYCEDGYQRQIRKRIGSLLSSCAAKRLLERMISVKRETAALSCGARSAFNLTEKRLV
jgi:hypothetical protein